MNFRKPSLSATDATDPRAGHGQWTHRAAGRDADLAFPREEGTTAAAGSPRAIALGSPLDSVIEILDAKGQPLPRATLRSLAKTYVIFRDHDSACDRHPHRIVERVGDGRLHSLGSELIRIWELPKNPDDDCHFWSRGGQRRGYLGTTPTFHPMGQPMYKVSIHPPGTTFPPNGLPIVTLYYRNDDGGGAFGKDSRLVFDPPADGDYQVRIGDARGQGSSRHAYQLTVRPPRPDFTVSFNPTTPTVSKGGAVSINVTRRPPRRLRRTH